MTGLWIFLLYFCITIAESSAGSLNVYGKQERHKSEPLILNLDEDSVPSSISSKINDLQGRFKRDTTGESNKTDKVILRLSTRTADRAVDDNIKNLYL
jgi:hypothetical protein